MEEGGATGKAIAVNVVAPPRVVIIGAPALVNYRSSGVWITGIVNGVHKKGGVVNGVDMSEYVCVYDDGEVERGVKRWGFKLVGGDGKPLSGEDIIPRPVPASLGDAGQESEDAGAW